jgi:hypothetical protein
LIIWQLKKNKTINAMTKTSPLAPENFPKFPVLDGIKFATAAMAMKYKDRDDLPHDYITINADYRS